MLCESLARFPEYFLTSERILFRLAIAENEPSIGNNATKIWRYLFWPSLSQVATPFGDRARLLKYRLSHSVDDVRKLCIDCALDALQPKTMGMAIPPQVVGGRLVPEPWQASSNRELLDLRTAFAKDYLGIASSLSELEKNYFDYQTTQNLMPFVWLDLVAEVREAIGVPAEDNLKTELLSAIRRAARIIAHERYGLRGAELARQLREWEDAIAPASLAERIKYWIQQNPWDLNQRKDEQSPFERLAEEIIRTPNQILPLSSSFSNPQYNGTMPLGIACGQKSVGHELDDLVTRWIRSGESSFFIVGFLLSHSSPEEGLQATWREVLDSVVTDQPEYVANVTAYVDASEVGYQRLARILDAGYQKPNNIFNQLAYGNWPRVLSIETKLEICHRLQKGLATEPKDALKVAIDLLYMWIHVNENRLPEALWGTALTFLEAALQKDYLQDAYKWSEIAGQLTEAFPPNSPSSRLSPRSANMPICDSIASKSMSFSSSVLASIDRA